MNFNVAYPLYVCLDDGGVIQIESFEKILYHLEAIDIENDEYLFWDAEGRGLKMLIKKSRVSGFEKTENRITLQQAFEGYAKQLSEFGVTVDTSGTPEQIWARVQSAKESLPRPASFFSRFFGGNRE
jgi:hypothetical protein